MELLVTTDSALAIADEELAQLVGNTLATTYPGYRWRVEPHAHPTKPFVDIRLEHGGNAMFGATVKPGEHYSASSLKREIVQRGGELLECFHLNRRAFNEVEFLGREKNFAGIIVPDW